MKIAVVGSRHGIDSRFVFDVLTTRMEKGLIDCVITGGAIGVDTFAEKWAKGKTEIKIYRSISNFI